MNELIFVTQTPSPRNYAPTLKVQQVAASRGCQQVLWLYGDDLQMTEAGTMNFFVYWINENGGE